MNFTVPQFIEEEIKVIGPLSFRQIGFIGTAIGICVFLWFTIENQALFFLLAAVILGSGAALALLKVNRTALPVYIKNLFFFIFKPKMYLWQKTKQQAQKTVKKAVKTEIKEEKKSSIPLTRKRSRIQDLSVKIGTKK